MNLPDYAYRNVVDLYNLHKDLANGTDDQRRQLTAMIVEQTTFDQPTAQWGHKAEKGGPVSKDTMGKVEAGILIAWDLFNGTTRAPNPSPMPSFTLNSATQELRYYIGVNHLNHGGTTPPPPDSNLQEQIDALKAEVDALETTVNELKHTSVVDSDAITLQTGDTDNYLTAEGGGGKTATQGKPGTTGPLATNRTTPGGWETWVIKRR